MMMRPLSRQWRDELTCSLDRLRLLAGVEMRRSDQLRDLAEWYRGWAKAGRDEDRAWRLGFADYLEKLATEADAADRGPSAGQPVLH